MHEFHSTIIIDPLIIDSRVEGQPYSTIYALMNLYAANTRLGQHASVRP